MRALVAQGATEASVVVLQFVTSSSVLLGRPDGGPEAAPGPLRPSPGSLASLPRVLALAHCCLLCRLVFSPGFQALLPTGEMLIVKKPKV